MNQLYIICRIGEAEYALPGSDIFQMETYTGATPVPGAPAYVAGLMQIRQQIVPVLDMRIRFGYAPVASTLDTRVVVLRLGERLVGLIVDSAKEVQNIASDQFAPPPEVLSKKSSGFVKSVAHLKNRIIMLIDSEKVLGEETIHG